ncbi:MAG TPA: glucosaminidase domain-containing protein [Acidisarcina sp.]
MGQVQDDFLRRAAAAAATAGHLFPEYAACEAALESGWGLSHLAVAANNLFGQKESHTAPPGAQSLSLFTREYLDGVWVSVPAKWVRFPDWIACFRERMNLLHRLSATYPHYKAALDAATGESFVEEVSKSWSTDPDRAGKVMSIHDHHRSAFD